jgi:ribosomal protein S18 acetylase RimI-like enzyme
MDGGWSWRVADDAEEVHELLCVSDAFQAEVSGTPAPVRRFSSTERYVGSGSVHVLSHGGVAAAMFTLSSQQPPGDRIVDFPPAHRPVYLQRLAVRPEYVGGGSIVGARCVRKAIELAVDAGADAVRCEVNPDLAGTLALLTFMGFEQCGQVYSEGPIRRAYLYRTISYSAG